MKRYALLIILFAVSSCIYDYDIPAAKDGVDAMVVDGNIVIGGKATLKASRLAPLAKRATNKKINPDSWWVEDDAGTRYDVDASGTVDLLTAPADKSYRMVIEYDGKTYTSAYQQSLTAPQIEDLYFSADETNVNCEIDFSLDSTAGRYVALTFEEIWEFHTDYVKDYDVDTSNWKVVQLDNPDYSHYYCWTGKLSQTPELIDLGILGGKAVGYLVNKFARTNSRNHRNYYLKVSARTMNEREYLFHSTLAQQDGGLNLYTPNPGEIAGNVVCEQDPAEYVYGYVSVSRTVSFERHLGSQFYIPTTPLKSSSFIIPDPELLEDYYWKGYWPIYHDLGKGIVWGPKRCIDCVQAGGVLEKPDYSE